MKVVGLPHSGHFDGIDAKTAGVSDWLLKEALLISPVRSRRAFLDGEHFKWMASKVASAISWASCSTPAESSSHTSLHSDSNSSLAPKVNKS